MASCCPALLSHSPQAADGLIHSSLTRGGRFAPSGWPICSETPADLLRKTQDVIVITKEIPFSSDEKANLGYDEESLTAYLVYYVWDGERDEYQQWTIFQTPIRNFEWIVLETRDVGDLRDTDSFYEATKSAAKFDENWFDNEMHTIQRSRLEKLQHIVFSGGGALEKERMAINQVLRLTSAGRIK